MRQLNISLGIAALIIVLLIILSKTCNSGEGRNCPPACNHIDQVTIDSIPVYDTIYQDKPVPVAYIPKGYVKVSDTVPDPLPEIEYVEMHDSSYIDYLIRVKEDYFALVAYLDSIQTPYGKIYLRDSVQRNRIKSRQITYNLNFPVTTITKTEKKRNVVLFAADASYRNDATLGIGGSLMFLTKKQAGIELGWQIDTRNLQTYNASYKVPIRLRKR